MAYLHDCPGGCGRQVPRHHFACGPCWARLPVALQRAISRAYRRDPLAHAQAMTDARKWYRAQAGPVG